MPAHDSTGSIGDLRSWLSAISHHSGNDYELLVAGGKAIPAADAAYGAMRSYLESAHADARQHFHELCGIDLHPMANGPGPRVEYPNRFVGNVRRGLFGEALCGVVAEACLFLSSKVRLHVPIFLFRFHSGVEEALNKLLQGGPETAIAGRHGDDFLAVELDDNNEVVRIVVGEAKFRTRMGVAEYAALMTGADGVLPKLSSEKPVPLSITKLTRLLKDLDGARCETIRASLEQVHLRQRTVERVDMVVLVYEAHAIKTPPPYASASSKPPEHSIKRPLVVVELHLPDAGALMDSLYDGLYH